MKGEKIMADMIKAKKGNHFVLTEYGKTYASYRDCEVGKPIEKDDDLWALECHVKDGVVGEVPDPDWVTKEGYSVVYNHNGYEISVGNSYVFAERELAERYLKHHQARPMIRNETLYIKETVYEGKKHKPCREYNGKRVYNKDWCHFDCLEIGDLVEAEIIDDMINALPPACMRSDCCQLGEPHSSRVDENGKGHNTYITFKRIADGIWEYCGDCFRGENVKRGTEIPYVV
jgi:hypothetical protein